MHRPLTGIIAALHTAFDDQEEVDFTALRDLVRRVVAQGVHGLFLCGTAAEFTLLSLEEREKITELAVAEASGQVAIAVHVGTPRPRDAVRLAQHAAQLGADALSSVPPYYYPYRPAAILAYLREVAASTDLPFYYYHIPERTGVRLDEAFLAELVAIPNLAGMKFSDVDLALLERLLRGAGRDCRFLCGVDELLLPALLLGAAGAIGSTYNFLAPAFAALWEACRAGKIEEARALQTRANRIIGALADFPALAASKEVLRLTGLDLGPPRLPGERLDPAEREALRRKLIAAGMEGIE
jgi:N-acetylneuraminate lyase